MGRGWDLFTSPDRGASRGGGVSGLFSSGGPSVRFLMRYDGEVSEPLVGRQGSRVSMRVARGSVSLLPSHGRGIWPRDVLNLFIFKIKINLIDTKKNNFMI